MVFTEEPYGKIPIFQYVIVKTALLNFMRGSGESPRASDNDKKNTMLGCKFTKAIFRLVANI